MSCATKGCTEDAVTYDDIEGTSTANCVQFNGDCTTCHTVAATLKGKDASEFFRNPAWYVFGKGEATAEVNAKLSRQIQHECNIAAPVHRVNQPNIYHVNPADEESIRNNAHEILHFYEHHKSLTVATQNAIHLVNILKKVGSLLKVLDNQDTDSEHLIHRCGDLIQNIIKEEDTTLPNVVHNQSINIIKQIPFILNQWNVLLKENGNNVNLLEFFKKSSACFPNRISEFVDTLTTPKSMGRKQPQTPTVRTKRKPSHKKQQSHVKSKTLLTKKTSRGSGTTKKTKGRRSQKRRLSQKKRIFHH